MFPRRQEHPLSVHAEGVVLVERDRRVGAVERRRPRTAADAGHPGQVNAVAEHAVVRVAAVHDGEHRFHAVDAGCDLDRDLVVCLAAIIDVERGRQRSHSRRRCEHDRLPTQRVDLVVDIGGIRRRTTA
jgi:hypothetical protein